MINSRTLAHTVLTLSEEKDAEIKIDVFFEYLSKNNLTGLLPQMLEHVTRLQSQSSEDDTLHIHARYELTEEEVKNIKEVTGAVGAEVSTHVDESVIGGFSATYKGHIYDGSLANQLVALKNVLTR
jgi:F0F1-type ATP synthase delta subunit